MHSNISRLVVAACLLRALEVEAFSISTWLVPMRQGCKGKGTSRRLSLHTYVGHLYSSNSNNSDYDGDNDTDDEPSTSSSFDEELDMDLLRDRLDQSKEDSYARLFRTQEWENRPKPHQAHVIIFKQDTPDEGVHSIEYPLGSGQNYILAFESLGECTNFVSALQDMDFFAPKVSFVL